MKRWVKGQVLIKVGLVWLVMSLGLFNVASIVEAKEGEQIEATVSPQLSSKLTRVQAREELQNLIDEGLFIASEQLRDIGTFYPYGVIMEANKEIKLVGIPAAEADKPEPKQTVDALKKALTGLVKKKRLRAVAVFSDFVAIRNDTSVRQSGIRVELEHQYPDNLFVFLPYIISPDKEVHLMTPQYMPGTLTIMPPKP